MDYSKLERDIKAGLISPEQALMRAEFPAKTFKDVDLSSLKIDVLELFDTE